MNFEKSKTMVISKERNIKGGSIKVYDEDLEQVYNFKYLGQTITPNGRKEKEIKIRIDLAKNRFQQMTKMFKSGH